MPNRDQLLQDIREALQPFLTSNSVTIEESTALVADLQLDSVKVMELLVAIEDRFDISIPLNILPQISTVSDLLDHLQPLLNDAHE